MRISSAQACLLPLACRTSSQSLAGGAPRCPDWANNMTIWGIHCPADGCCGSCVTPVYMTRTAPIYYTWTAVFPNTAPVMCELDRRQYVGPKWIKYSALDLAQTGLQWRSHWGAFLVTMSCHNMLRHALRHLSRPKAAALIGSLLVGSCVLKAQSSSTPSVGNAQGERAFSQLCTGCHGADARGTDQGPALAGNRRVRSRSLQNLRDLIQNGIPNAGMPTFHLPADQLDDLVALVHSLNAPAAESNLPGDPAAGKEFFFGKGLCSSCHMVDGEGKPIGPDLSNIGGDRRLDELRTALLDPRKRVSAGYQMVSVRLRTGRVLRGFARGRSNFDLCLQDLSGNFHLLQQDQILSTQVEKSALMPPTKASLEELQNLMCYLSRLTGVHSGGQITADSVSGGTGGVTFEQILKPSRGEWPTYNGNVSANRYSELTSINTKNLSRLGVKWTFSIPLWKQFFPETPYYVQNLQTLGLEATPIVVNGIMYVTGPNSVYALDAQTGREIWEYSRPRTTGIVGDAALGTNKGVAVLGDKVFMVTDNAHLLALNRTTGQVMWEIVMPETPQHYGSTVSPLIVKDLVIAGVSGGDWGIRGFLAAYKASTGERVWRFWTIPAKGEPGSETWKGKEPVDGGGATWLTGSYDPETDTLYWPTGNPFPDSDDRNRPGANLYTDCILALAPETGTLKWYYQFTPHDVHDWDSNEPPVLVDARFRGKNRKLLLLANRNGFFYVMDRTNGEVLLAKSFVKRLTWASGISPDGRPQTVSESQVSCPQSATNWSSTAFSPLTHLYYVMALEHCVVKLSRSNWKKPPQPEPGEKYLRALNIETGETEWEVRQIGPAEGKRVAGVLATAGGLLFYGDPGGDFVAASQHDGHALWHFPSGDIYKASPMTYLVNGKQYVAIAAGSHIISFGLQ